MLHIFFLMKNNTKYIYGKAGAVGRQFTVHNPSELYVLVNTHALSNCTVSVLKVYVKLANKQKINQTMFK